MVEKRHLAFLKADRSARDAGGVFYFEASGTVLGGGIIIFSLDCYR